jgi:hypothetical protein
LIRNQLYIKSRINGKTSDGGVYLPYRWHDKSVMEPAELIKYEPMAGRVDLSSGTTVFNALPTHSFDGVFIICGIEDHFAALGKKHSGF